MQRLALVRHGETDGESSVRYHGSTDVALSDAGRAQMRAARRRLPDQGFDLAIASPLQRSWQATRILFPHAPIEIVEELREIDFGEWEGLTAEEIAAQDPPGFRHWQERSDDFAFPGGEHRAAFRARVSRGLARVAARGLHSVVGALHHGVIRAIAEELTGERWEGGPIALGAGVLLRRDPKGGWTCRELGAR
ncbi:MAG: histidine phosphatase family protein [Myxococcota bacterium]|nr:histidine phosphatase family protein [Myxococcales bacterium]